MIRVRNIRCLSALLLSLLFCCRKPYNPNFIASAGSYLVVDGIINAGNDSTIFFLSKTVNTNAKKTANPVVGASVEVESDAGGSWPLISDSNGRYVSGPLNLSSSQNYRIHVSTSDGLQYVSDFVPLKLTPPIDSVGYTINNGIIQLYVNAHDPSNNTHYYRWEYAETWQFHSQYPSYLQADTFLHQLIIRPYAQQIYSCFGNDISTNVLLFSTTDLSKDIVYQRPLITIPLTSEKVEMEYSIIVRQYALTTDAYQFYTLLKKNTEDIGNIFGHLPSTLTGNIHCINHPDQPAIGYITATNVQSKRIFIYNKDLPPTTTIYPYYCYIDTSYSDNLFLYPPFEDTPIAPNENGSILYSTRGCVDCTIRGTTPTPSFWKPVP
jgi:hypothetical protein